MSYKTAHNHPFNVIHPQFFFSVLAYPENPTGSFGYFKGRAHTKTPLYPHRLECSILFHNFVWTLLFHQTDYTERKRECGEEKTYALAHCRRWSFVWPAISSFNNNPSFPTAHTIKVAQRDFGARGESSSYNNMCVWSPQRKYYYLWNCCWNIICTIRVLHIHNSLHRYRKNYWLKLL